MNSPKSTHPSDKQEAQAAIAILRKHDHTAPPKPESHLARIARERREARAATGAAPPPVMPRTKLKRHKTREVIVEVEKKPLMFKVGELAFHPHLQRVGLLPDLISRETEMGNNANSNRHAHKDRAESLATELTALKLSILDQGVREPLKVVKDAKGRWLVVDGRHRYEVARDIVKDNAQLNAAHTHNPTWLANADKLEKEGLPCIEIQPGEVDSVILAALTRRHFSKQQLAYTAILICPKVATDVSAGRPNKSGNDYPITQVTLAERIGVSYETMKSACEFHRWVLLDPVHRDEWEAQLYAGISFSNVMIGALGSAATSGKNRIDRTVWKQLEEKLSGLKTQFAALSPLLEADPKNREYLTEQVRVWVEQKMPAPIREIWIHAMQSVRNTEPTPLS